jgi:hypothetical protein
MRNYDISGRVITNLACREQLPETNATTAARDRPTASVDSQAEFASAFIISLSGYQFQKGRKIRQPDFHRSIGFSDNANSIYSLVVLLK